jgi:site-specific recombinase XerC
VYWVMTAEDGRRQSLSALKKMVAYGFTIRRDSSDQSFWMTLLSQKRREIHIYQEGGKVRAVILIGGQAAYRCKIYVQAQNLLRVRARISDDSLVFPSRNGSYLRPGNLHKRSLLPACAKEGLRRFSWHDFRRTHATLLSDLGEPLKTAQAQLGHASLSTTADVYAQAIPGSQRAAIERLETTVGFLADPSGPKFENVIQPGSSLIQ